MDILRNNVTGLHNSALQGRGRGGLPSSLYTGDDFATMYYIPADIGNSKY